MDEMEKRFQRLCSEELAYLRGGVFRIVGNADDTDDVIQESLLKAYRRADSFREDSNLRSWVYRIAVNCAFDFLRDRKRQEETSHQYVVTASGQKDGHSETRLAKLEQAVAELPEIYREAVVWGCLSELSGSEAAVRVGCTENALYQRVFKAKQMLKKRMMQEEA